MRLTTGELRTTLRESIAESERVAAENAAAVAKLEKESRDAAKNEARGGRAARRRRRGVRGEGGRRRVGAGGS